MSSLSTAQKDLIIEASRLGKTATEIGLEFGIDYDVVGKVIQEEEVEQNRSHHARLREIVNDLEDQCTRTKVSLDEGGDSAMMLQSYQRLMAEYRVALADLMSLQKPQDIVDDIIEQVFNPFLIDLIRASTEEMNNLKAEMLKLNVPVRDANGISAEIFRRLTDRIQKLVPSAGESLHRYFGAKSKPAKTYQ